MRRAILSVVAVLISAMAFSQSNSPEALYERGMGAISGAGPSRNDHDAIEYFRRSADLGYGPLKSRSDTSTRRERSPLAAKAKLSTGTARLPITVMCWRNGCWAGVTSTAAAFSRT